jgi:hypothetical protein
MTSSFPRFESPAQLALVGAGVWLLGALIVHPLAPLGLLLLLASGVAYVLRPKSQSMYWRGRRIDLDNRTSAGSQLYHTFFKR